MQTLHGDASSNVRSLDDVFYYGGPGAHNMRAVVRHVARGPSQLSFDVGDLVHIAGNHWDGFSKGTHNKSGKTGLYPSYKVVNVVQSVRMPTYPEVRWESSEVDTGRARNDHQ